LERSQQLRYWWGCLLMCLRSYASSGARDACRNPENRLVNTPRASARKLNHVGLRGDDRVAQARLLGHHSQFQ
jgi:hypothetical protein